MKKNTEIDQNNLPQKELNRRDALKKAGKYAALTSATLFLVLSPKANADDQVSEPAPPPDFTDFGF